MHLRLATYHIQLVSGLTPRFHLSIILAIKVSIEISYTSPDQYPDYTPPNYRAASSVTLRCVASGTSGHVTYRWSSTCGSCFASSSSSQTVSETILRSRDAGVHTCSVTDSLGNTGSDVITMNIVGKWTTHSPAFL